MVGINQATGQDVLLELVGGNEARELRCATLLAEDDSVHVMGQKFCAARTGKSDLKSV